MNPRLVAADAAIAKGNRSEAVDLIIAVLEDNVPASAQIFRVLLKNLLALRRYADGARWAAAALELDPADYEFHNYLGVFLRRTSRYAEAIDVLDRAIAMRPHDPVALINKGNICNDLRDGVGAEAIFAKLVQGNPRNAEFQRSLGRALWWQGKLDGATMRMRQATALQKDNLDAWLDLSGILVDSGKAEASLKVIEKAIAANPDTPRLLRAKAGTFRRLGRAAEAEKFLESMRHKLGDASWYHFEYGRLLSDVDRARATGHFRRAVELDPDDIDSRMALIESLDRTREGDESANIDEAYRLVKETKLPGQLEPPHSKVIVEILTRSADYAAAAQIGDFTQLGRNWATNFLQGALLSQMPRVKTADDRRELLHQHRLWGDAIIDRARRNPVRHPAPRAPSPKIRIGFMSSDLRRHPVTYFAWPLFEYADRERFEIFCYSFYSGIVADPAQQFIASKVDAFRWNRFMGERDAAQMIADDQLDILFELGGSTHMNKIEVMAWKPARLTASWLGYPHSAGLSTIDYLLVDPFLNPPDSDLLIEKPLIMPHCWLSLDKEAFDGRHKIEAVIPARRNNFVTFGTANNPYKYNPGVLKTWAQVMARVPNSRFIFVRPESGSKAFVDNIRACFAAEGVASERIEFRAIRGGHMPHYNDIDIALDPFPQTGGTTTCEAAWMGVPTVTLVGDAMYERMSYSVLSNAGLGDLCAFSRDDYIDIAVRLAADPDRLQALRTGLRDQLRASPLGQTRQFAQDFYDLVARTVHESVG